MSIKPDVRLVDRLAQLQLSARRLGFELRLVAVSPAVFELIDLCGLSETLRVEVERHPKERE